MMSMTINVAGTPVRVDYGSVTDDPNAFAVTFTQKDNNQTGFDLHSNPQNIPMPIIRTIVRCVHEQLIRQARDIPSPLYICLEK